MTLVIGTDEAGYGPNLGPLVIAATAWQVADDSRDAAAIDRDLEEAVAEGSRAAGLSRPLWTDSKLVHRGPNGFAAVERAALGGLVAVAPSLPARESELPRDWPDLDSLLGGIDAGTSPPVEAAALATLPLPAEAQGDDCRRAGRAVAAAAASRGLAVRAIRCRVIQPAEFNAAVAAGLNKADILSRATLGLAAELRAMLPDEQAFIWCDRHGGRRSYAPLLTNHFETPLVRVLEEAAERSAYALPDRRCTVEFRVGGESRVPVALASLTAKYVRELAMLAFNAFWRGRVPGLRATAGYPVDAARWRNDAATAVAAAGCGWDAVWRRV